jgi:DNA helicase II / ATP-dependent DNA helicase PcrA
MQEHALKIADAGEPIMQPATPSYLDTLNPPQREAVVTLDGPVLVLSGAGTGKTRVLTTRIAHLLNQRKAWPGEILAVTFTNKAAREMALRANALLHADESGRAVLPWLGTFHSISAKMLRQHAEKLGFRSDFVILDTDDQLRLIKTILQEQHIDIKQHPPKQFLYHIQQWKDKGLTPDKISAAEAATGGGYRTLETYKEYQSRLLQLNAMDFGDLMLHCLTLFTTHQDVLQHYAQRFKYILVDEYQDTNISQYLWLRLLALGHKNICCVGDDDQSIYGWRGAEVGNILKFERDFPGATVIRLEQNYRSTPQILAVASHLIAICQ